MSIREKLRSHLGCVSCKKRKKKCDEKKPVCSACARLRLKCQWEESSTQKTTNEIEGALGSETISFLDSDDTRAADYDGEQVSREMNFDSINHSFSQGRPWPTSTTDFAKAFDEHIILTGVLRGWDSVHRQFGLDRQWDHIIQLDQQTAQCGHGSVARMASIWCFRMMMKYFTERDQASLPAWYLPRQSQINNEHPAIVDFFPWPAVRERLVYQQDRYCNDRFINAYMKHGFRFIWPHAIDKAIVWDQSLMMLRASPEFRLRVLNLRSFTMSRDFLEVYPDFRGEAPQLEASATLQTLSSTQQAEQLYWNLVRHKKSQLTTHNRASKRVDKRGALVEEDEHC